jgi:hypothetical protein
MAASMSARLTGVAGAATIPFKAVTERWIGTIS